jgi:hypothetical protein
MDVLNGLKNFLQFINDNWTTICVIVGLLIALYIKIKNYLKLSKDEKIAIAKTQIKETILRLVTEAESDYAEWAKAGAVKRAQVIEQIFAMYPALSKVANQEDLIVWIDEMIDKALVTLRDIIAENAENLLDNVDNDDVAAEAETEN